MGTFWRTDCPGLRPRHDRFSLKWRFNGSLRAARKGRPFSTARRRPRHLCRNISSASSCGFSDRPLHYWFRSTASVPFLWWLSESRGEMPMSPALQNQSPSTAPCSGSSTSTENISFVRVWLNSPPMAATSLWQVCKPMRLLSTLGWFGLTRLEIVTISSS